MYQMSLFIWPGECLWSGFYNGLHFPGLGIMIFLWTVDSNSLVAFYLLQFSTFQKCQGSMFLPVCTVSFAKQWPRKG